MVEVMVTEPVRAATTAGVSWFGLTPKAVAMAAAKLASANCTGCSLTSVAEELGVVDEVEAVEVVEVVVVVADAGFEVGAVVVGELGAVSVADEGAGVVGVVDVVDVVDMVDMAGVVGKFVATVELITLEPVAVVGSGVVGWTTVAVSVVSAARTSSPGA